MLARYVDALVTLVGDADRVGPSDLALAVESHARRGGAQHATVYLVDLQQNTLVPLGTEGERHDIEGSLPGMAYRTLEPVDVTRGEQTYLWVPMLDGSARVGVLELTLDALDGLGDETVSWARLFGEVVTLLVVTRDAYGDTIARTRRTRPVDLATELRYAVLPPSSFSTDAFDLTAVLEPAYEVAGDGFDFAFDWPTLHFSITDAVGHGLTASLLANLVTAALRHARFWDLELEAAYRTASEIVQSEFGSESFVTAQVGRLDVERGVISLVNAGHPQPLLLRNHRFAVPVEAAPAPPIGAALDVSATVTTIELEPDDVLLFFTDGVTEARSPDGQRFGVERLEDFLVQVAASDEPPPELLRRLVRRILAHADDPLQDDACLLLIRWGGGA